MFTTRLMMVVKLGVFSFTFQKHSKSGTLVLYANYQKMGYEILYEKVLKYFLTYRKQMVVLNEQSSSWRNVNAGVPPGFILETLLFSICINDLAEGLPSNTKHFADDTSPFSIMHVFVITTSENNSGPVRT